MKGREALEQWLFNLVDQLTGYAPPEKDDTIRSAVDGLLDDKILEDLGWASPETIAKEYVRKNKSEYIDNYGYICGKGIIAHYLKLHGYDGIYNPEGECSCALKDLFPCTELSYDCKAGHRMPCPDDCGEHDYHIGEKPAVADIIGGSKG